jgi:hypothetical protein
VREAREEMDAGIEPEIEFEERSLSANETLINHPLWVPEHVQNKQRVLQALAPCQTVDWVRQPLVPDDQGLQC